ncbi:MAG: glucosaminidase domain-containing protein [Thermoleophilia bacterium]|nr:glucosaminidase domain-containing protein [Thermoleophilia bacterium]
MAVACLLVAGCGGKASIAADASGAAAPGAPATPVASSSTTVVSASGASADGVQQSQPPSLHERVMAEQRLREASAATYQPTTTTSAASLESAAAPADSPAGPADTTAVVLAEGQTPLRGVWSGTADRLATYLLGICPSPCFAVPVPDLAEYYLRYCAEAGLRADLLWAQMIHETGYGMYGGCVVPEQNNYAGIGATGGGEPGITFPTAEAGVIAHVAHMVAYVYEQSPVAWADAIADPRFDFVNPRGAANVLADLNGRWAVPGTTYGQSIEGIALAINNH